MKHELLTITTDFHGERCYVHARGVLQESGFGLITMQKLELSGCDVFYGIEMIKTYDHGKSFTSPTACEGLARRYSENGESEVICDATPFYHKATGKIILVGHLANYGANNAQTRTPKRKTTAYAVYDDKCGDFLPYKTVDFPSEITDTYYTLGSGCSQIYELDSGELLIPFYFRTLENIQSGGVPNFCAAVMRCSFDGECIKLLEIGNTLKVSTPRGVCEPSVIKHGEEFFLALRNDKTGYISKSADGLHFDEPKELCFDDGENAGNYNTQQHLLVGGGRLWMVYTRRAENNSHVFRHRAPLFIAEIDKDTLTLKRETEYIVVPERGARLGNFGVQSYSIDTGYVFASEWMQGDNGLEGSMKYGSDNSIFVSKITY